MDKEKEYCMTCHNELVDLKSGEYCPCGGNSVVYGKTISYIEGDGLRCSCGGNQWNRGAHFDFKDKAVTNYSCTKCGSLVSTETRRSKDDPMGYDDED